MLVRAFSIIVFWFALAPVGSAAATAEPDPVTTAPPSTFNVFYPQEQSLGDCLSSLPRPNCGSDARGGWRQTAVFGSIIAALAFIGWRIVRGARRARAG